MTEQDAVGKFIEQVRWLYEPEFGDFKRKVGLYIQRLQDSVPAMQRGSASQIIAQMRTAALYDPSGDMEATRKDLLALAQKVLSSGQH